LDVANFKNDHRCEINAFRELILEWHKTKNRNYFFWRRTRNPYHILIAETMLQKTTANQVQSLIKTFLSKFPSIEDLANASVEDIEAVITPLGMEHKRAVNYKKMAEIIKKKYGGNVPSSEEELLSLPGVGRYIANSVLCFAFGKDVPILDTNVLRVLERVFGVKSDKARARTDKRMWNIVKVIIPPGMARQINLALLDFGALVCTAKKPKHFLCPVSHICNYYTRTERANTGKRTALPS
jgi:A/G-specific adenine glycosylase